MTSTAQHFTDRADRFATILDGAAGLWDAPTPCEDWTARDVVAHVVETEREFLDRQGYDLGAAPDLTDPAAGFRRHAGAVAEVLGRDGVADRAYDGYFGPTTVGDTMADFYGWDLVVHGSDVARATGQPWSVSEEEAADLHATADAWGDALYSEGVCGPAVELPDDASPSDRLLTRLGRDPGWRPPA